MLSPNFKNCWKLFQTFRTHCEELTCQAQRLKGAWDCPLLSPEIKATLSPADLSLAPGSPWSELHRAGTFELCSLQHPKGEAWQKLKLGENR